MLFHLPATPGTAPVGVPLIEQDTAGVSFFICYVLCRVSINADLCMEVTMPAFEKDNGFIGDPGSSWLGDGGSASMGDGGSAGIDDGSAI